MMKQTQTIFVKYCGRAFSTVASSPMYSSLVHRLGEQNKSALCVAFIDLYRRREHWYKVNRMYDENAKRKEELYHRSVRCRDALFQALQMAKCEP